MGGSHDNMMTLENRVRGLERVVEDMARDLSISTGRRAGGVMPGFKGFSNRHLGKYNGFPDYFSTKLGRGSNDWHIPFGGRYAALHGAASGMRSRGPSWRSDAPDASYIYAYGNSGQRKVAGGGVVDIRSTKLENETDQVSSRRAWEKGSQPVRFGEGPSARSVWQASKDEATLEAIRFAGEDNGDARNARVAMPEMTSEALENDGTLQERDPTWTPWSNAMDALHVGDMDSVFSEVLSTGDDLLLAQLMEQSGPVIYQLSLAVSAKVLHAVAQLFLEPNLFKMCLYWFQQVYLLIVSALILRLLRQEQLRTPTFSLSKINFQIILQNVGRRD